REIYEKERAHVLAPWSAWGASDPMVVTAAEGCHLWDGDGNKFLDFTSQLVNTNIGHQHPVVVKAIQDQAAELATINPAQGAAALVAAPAAAASRLWDGSDNKFLASTAQLVNTNIGHQHPVVVKAIQDQAAELATINPAHANAARAEAARLVAEVAPAGMNRVFFTNAGTEAVEHAVRMARRHTGRHKTLSAFRSYHGATTTSMNLTGDTRRWANDMGNTGAVHFHAPFLYRSQF